MFFLGAVLLCWTVATGADKPATAPPAPPRAQAPAKSPTTKPAAPAGKAAAKAPKVYYDLAFRPAVGMRFASESTNDTEIDFRATANVARVTADHLVKARSRVVALCEEITALDAQGFPIARRVTFGPDCFTVSTDGKQPERKLRMVYAGKTVNFRLNPQDDTIEQDFGVRPKPEDMRRLRNAMKGSTALFAGKPVAVGDRWRADEGLRALANLKENDTVSSLVTLKNVRDGENGAGKIADLAVSAAVITSVNGVHGEVSLEGAISVDVKTGQILTMDLAGDVNVSGGVGTLTSGRAHALSLRAAGKMELHARARLLPPAPPSTPSTQPANLVANDRTAPAETPARRSTVRLLED